jgi:DNA-binding NtrC family response regulator
VVKPRPADRPFVFRNFGFYFWPAAPAHAGNGQGGPILTLSEIERQHIFKVLAHTGGNKQAAARALGIDRTTLLRKIERYKI